MSNYYTPDISEFYIGFECEIRNSSNEPFDWEYFRIIGVDDAEIPFDGIKWSLMDWSFYDSYNAIKEECIRVKYLDKEDIEDLGWLYDWESINRYESGEFILFIENNGDVTIKEQFEFTKKGTNYVTFDTVFSGKIKNKSELKKLMVQLRIE